MKGQMTQTTVTPDAPTRCSDRVASDIAKETVTRLTALGFSEQDALTYLIRDHATQALALEQQKGKQ
jgi:hypothetical protein